MFVGLLLVTVGDSYGCFGDRGFGGDEVQTGFVYFGVTFGDVFPCGCLLNCFIIFVVGYLGMFSWMARYFGLFGVWILPVIVYCCFVSFGGFFFNKLVLKLFLGLFECLVLWFETR